jgi:hypothetical protein
VLEVLTKAQEGSPDQLAMRGIDTHPAPFLRKLWAILEDVAHR